MRKARLRGAHTTGRLFCRLRNFSKPILTTGIHMAKKKVSAVVKIQIPAGQASPAPPVGTALGPHGVAIMDFCKAYNAQTEDKRGQIIPVEISIYDDRSFTFITKTPPTPFLIRQAAGLDKASQEPGRAVAGSVTAAQVKEIAELKMPDLNANDIEGAILQVEGTARSMGIEVK
jgi:large subunit ribosomal protein L11